MQNKELKVPQNQQLQKNLYLLPLPARESQSANCAPTLIVFQAIKSPFDRRISLLAGPSAQFAADSPLFTGNQPPLSVSFLHPAASKSK